MLLILGSLDAEANLIEKIANEIGGFTVAYAAAPIPFGPKKGEMGRVGPGVAATGYLVDGKYFAGSPADPYLAVEQMPGAATLTGPIQGHFDHHDLKNPNTHRPPAEAWEASSIGQFVRYLQTQQEMMYGVIPEEWLEIAACDHCLGAACAGAVPGVDLSPGTDGYTRLMWRTYATYGAGVSIEKFTEAVAASVSSLESAPNWGNTGVEKLDKLLSAVPVADLRDLPIDGPVAPTGETYPSKAQYLPVTGSMTGKPYIVKIQAKHGAALRLGGFDGGHPEHRKILELWAECWENWGVEGPTAPQPRNLYCFPARGMGGATLI